MRIIAYTYEGDIHCAECAAKRRFRYSPESLNAPDGTANDDNGVPIHAVDSEGNRLSPVFSTDEIERGQVCGDCGEEIRP